MTKKATIIFFDPKKNLGYLQIESQTNQHRFNASHVAGEPLILLKDEVVNVKLSADGKHVNSILRTELRFTGEILNYENGVGVLLCFQDKKEYPVYFKDFVFSDRTPVHEVSRIHVEAGDEVEFSLKENEEFGTKAALIISDGKKPIEKFAYLPSFDSQLAELAKLSPEPWDYMNSDPEKFLPVLRNYLYYTFARLRTEERIYGEKRIAVATAEIKYKDKITRHTGTEKTEVACFNTGLATNYQEEIFAFFKKNKYQKSRLDPEWYLVKFIKASDPEMKYFDPKPEWANYFKDLDSISEILYDPSLSHDLKYEHILKDRQQRFPDAIKNLPEATLNSLLDSGLEKARRRVRRNYKAAVPQYYNGKLQLLLPLCLVSDDKADLALSVEKDGKRYISRTVLELEWAYSNARLLAKPDREWLDPVKDIDSAKLDSVILEASESEKTAQHSHEK